MVKFDIIKNGDEGEEHYLTEEQLERAAIQLVEEAIAHNDHLDLCADLAICTEDRLRMEKLSASPVGSDNYLMWKGAMVGRMRMFCEAAVQEKAINNYMKNRGI